MKIAHISDTHIRNFERFDQYKAVFSSLYSILREKEVDYIIHTGDIAHKKTNISPEFVELCSDFLKNLEAIAPTYIILGNHDGNLRNSDRQDALSPIVNLANLENLHLLKDSGEYKVDDKLTLNVLSVFDLDNWVEEPSDDSKINIALYHGGIKGSQTDIGWNIKVDHDTSIFEAFDYAMLGDIHKSNQILDKHGRIRYAGSTIQQDHGETPDKGFLLWDIESKDDFDVEHIVLPDPNPHLDIVLTPSGKLPEGVEVPPNSRVRIVAENKIGISQQRKILDIAKKRFNPQRITFKNKESSESFGEEVVSGLDIGDLRSVDVQNKLIEEYLKDYNLSKETLNEVIQLNSKMNRISEAEAGIQRNVNWSIEKLEFNNLFNYGESNSIDFSTLGGIIGILGKNYSGKSSIIDSLLFTMQNNTSKNSVKNVNIINQNRKSASSKVSLSIGNVKYFIERRMEKYSKRLKGKETEEAKMELDFWSEDQVTGEIRNHNGDTRNTTDANIRKILGTRDDFMITSFCSQMDSLNFINLGSVDRKKVLSKFIGLDIFEERYRAIKESASDINGALKQHHDRDYEVEIEEEKKILSSSKRSLRAQKKKCETLKSSLKSKELELRDIEIKIASYPKIDIDIDKIKVQKSKTENKLSEAKSSKLKREELVRDNEKHLSKIDEFSAQFSYEDLKNERESVLEVERELLLLTEKQQHLEERSRSLDSKISLLNEVPCGDKFPSCKFLHDAVESKGLIDEVKSNLVSITSKRKASEEKAGSLDKEAIESRLDKYDSVMKNRAKVDRETSELRLEVEKLNYKIKEHERNLESLAASENEYYENEKDCKIIASLFGEKRGVEEVICGLNGDLGTCEDKIHSLIADSSGCEQRIANLEEKQSEYEELKTQNIAYDMLAKCMEPNGISSDIIKKYLPVINEEINKVLLPVVQFEVFFEIEDKRLNVYIKHPKYEQRVIEMASGAEKTLASMAIRLALTKIGTLPKSDIFILDEPATDLDSDNMEGFIGILEMLKSQFKTVILISHLDVLKECVDDEIIIDKRDGFAHVRV